MENAPINLEDIQFAAKSIFNALKTKGISSLESNTRMALDSIPAGNGDKVYICTTPSERDFSRNKVQMVYSKNLAGYILAIAPDDSFRNTISVCRTNDTALSLNGYILAKGENRKTNAQFRCYKKTWPSCDMDSLEKELLSLSDNSYSSRGETSNFEDDPIFKVLLAEADRISQPR